MTRHPMTDDILRDVPAHASIPFWSWNDRLEPERLRAQIRRMKELKMGGFFMHARGGLETEYLSEEWFDAVRASVDEGEKCGMEAWAYDENGWPSGFAGGILLQDEENLALYLKASEETDWPEDASVLAVFRKTASGYARTEKPGEGPYLAVHLLADHSYVDTMDASVTEKFIAVTHERYLRELPEGAAMPGFFTDEPQYFRWATPYSHVLPEAFRARYGYDVRDTLWALFRDGEGAEELRYDYYSLIHDLFMENFARPIYEWCEAHGMQLTGHSIEETSLSGQMMCSGGVMPFYRYQHVPGMDYLSRYLANDLGPKQLGSACAQLGRKRVLSEMFACCGWDVSPRELKDIAELQYVGGVNVTCQHLYPYSERGQRKRDFPLHYSDILPWQDSLIPFNEYFNNLGSALSQGEEVAPVLVIHPMHTAYLHYKHFTVDDASVRANDDALKELLRLLGDGQVSYHFGDERMMADMASAEGGKIRVGRMTYDHVLISGCETLDSSTVALLRAYLGQGGKLCIRGEAPCRVDGHPADLSDLRSNETFEELAAAAPVHVSAPEDGRGLRLMVRDTAHGRLIYVKNLSGHNIPRLTLTAKDCGPLAALSMEDLTLSPVAGRPCGGGYAVELALDARESVVLVEADLPGGELRLPQEKIALPRRMRLASRPENALLLDRAALSENGGEWTELRPLERIRDELLQERFQGKIALRFPFAAEWVPARLLLVAEPLQGLEIRLNGHLLAPCGEKRLDDRFLCYEAAPFVKQGENEIVLSGEYYQQQHVYDVLNGNGTEALRNCLSFDTEIENLCLLGDFSVACPGTFTEEPNHALRYDGPFAIAAPAEEIDASDPVRSGYPFFFGRLDLRTTLSWKPGDATLLALHGRFGVCGVEVNGQWAGEMLFAQKLELAPYLREGENEIRLTPACALRNLYGPHHRKNAEPLSVGPGTFSFEKEWKNGACPNYDTRYAFVRFGIGTDVNP